MSALNRKSVLAGQFSGEFSQPNALPAVRILQIGDGNFLRGFADWMIDVANGKGLFNGAVTIAAPLAQGLTDKLNEQECLYTVLMRGVQNGKETEACRIITCVEKGINPYADWAGMVACAQDPSLRFVISNTTEAGIAHAEEPLVAGATPNSFPAKVTSLLLERFNKLGGTAKTGLIFLPCELIEANGAKLRKFVLQYAQEWKLPEAFVQWVEQHNVFLNTLVDRIVPGFPANEAEALYKKFGYTDTLTVAAEPFHVWVIEAPKAQLTALSDEFPLHKAGLDVVWTDDLQPYRTRKVRILNGAHTASALAAYSAGIDTVQGMIDDNTVSKYLNKVMFEEIVPFVPLPEAERQSYAKTIMERFGNPYIRHELISITLNSVSKWQVRVLPTVKDFVKERQMAPAGLGFSLAAVLYFYRGEPASAGALEGKRDTGAAYPIKDSPEVLNVLADAWQKFEAHQSVEQLTTQLLSNTNLWGEDLTAVAGLADVVKQELDNMLAKGVKKAMAELVGAV